DEGQARPNLGEHDEGQAGPNPGDDAAGIRNIPTNPGDVAASQPPSSHVVHAGPNLEHMDLEASDTSIQPNPEQIDEEFTIMSYPNVQENLKSQLKVNFANQFLVDKSQDDEPKKTNTESEVNQALEERLDKQGNRLYNLENLDIPYKSDKCTSTAAPSSLKTAASAEYTAWMTTDIRLKPSVTSIPEELHMEDDTTPEEQVQSYGDEDIGHDHIPMVNLRQNWWKPLTEDIPATPEPSWSIPLSDLPVPVNNWASALASTYAPPLENSLLAQTGDMAIFMDWFCKKQGITELKQQDLEGPA
ncbi:hypothetical protein Tco_0005855, partial [Tanacetum coccineum]